MTIIATESPATGTSGYRDAVSSASDDNRRYAGDITERLIEVFKAFAAIKHRMHGASPQEGLDHALLLRLAHTGPMRASDLADRLCADPSTVSRQVAGLVKAGLVERRADPDDGRASILVPTPEGQVRVNRMIEMRGRLFAPLVAGWSSDDRAVFSRLLTEFAHGLTTDIEAVKSAAAELLEPTSANTQGSDA